MDKKYKQLFFIADNGSIFSSFSFVIIKRLSVYNTDVQATNLLSAVMKK